MDTPFTTYWRETTEPIVLGLAVPIIAYTQSFYGHHVWYPFAVQGYAGTSQVRGRVPLTATTSRYSIKYILSDAETGQLVVEGVVYYTGDNVPPYNGITFKISGIGI